MSEPIHLDPALALVKALTRPPGQDPVAPYRWQRRLLGRMLDGHTPDAVDIPTGLGKTRVMALWLAARALGAELPRRLVYVVDRRAVVDQASHEAAMLAENLHAALSVLGDGAEAARRNLGLAAGQDLPISTLRGQLPKETRRQGSRWLDAPGGAAIVVGTVDMIGSRLLFGGYGVGRGTRPMHAGLLGADTLVLIDEAHLVPPFEALLRAVAHEPRPSPVPKMRVMALSATGAAPPEATVFHLEAEDRQEDAVRRRLDARKALKLHKIDDLVAALTARALELAQTRGGRILVFCNARDRGARDIADKLKDASKRLWGEGERVALLVGGRRQHERTRDFGDPALQAFMAGGPRPTLDGPLFLVATSAGEVGIDLDADHMVCDLVPWERMVQRLGRVNRTGRPETALVDVYWSAAPPKDPKDKPEVDSPVHERLQAYLAPFETEAWPRAEGDPERRQAGPGALAALRAGSGFAEVAKAATTPEPLRPGLTRAHLEAWAMTSLKDHPGRPRIAPWLRGWTEDAPQASVVWRALLSPRPAERRDRALIADLFEHLPPHASERLETDAWRIVHLAKARATAVLKRDDPAEREALDPLAAVLLNADTTVEGWYGLAQLAETDAGRLTTAVSGRTLVLDARLGGLADGLLDPKAGGAVLAIDTEHEHAGARVAELDGWRDLAGRRLRKTVTETSRPLEKIEWVRLAGWPTTPTADEPDEEWRVERKRGDPELGDPARSTQAQALAKHHDWTAGAALAIADALGLADVHRQVLEVAARAHDLGKARDTWQTAMGARRDGRPYAKTDGRTAAAALLTGYRHEFGSLKDGEAGFAGIADEGLRDLARHLVVAHHGHARPVIKPYDPDEPPSLSMRRARDAALRFARLQAEWGPWGLAWWESLLRAADWTASRRLEEEGADG